MITLNIIDLDKAYQVIKQIYYNKFMKNILLLNNYQMLS